MSEIEPPPESAEQQHQPPAPAEPDAPVEAKAPTEPPEPDAPTQPVQAVERETSRVELLWDLVFVFAVTQVATLLSHDTDWVRFGEAMLALAIVWWAWSAFVWASNAVPADSLALRGYLLTCTVLIFIVGLALPHAFGSQGLLFACTYTVVRLVHLKLYADAASQGRARRESITGFALTVALGMALLIGGAFVNGWPRAALWTAGIAIDYAGPAWLTRERLRGLQRVAVAHFGDRYGDFVIICLGESVLSVGVGVADSGRALTTGLVVAAVLGLLIAIGMWWTYFHELADRAQERLRDHEDPVLAAADSFSYLHLVIVAGIIVFAGGVRIVVRGTLGAPMPDPGRLAFCGGVALYLVGVSAFRLRLLGEHSPGRLSVAVAMLALFALGSGTAAWVITLITALLVLSLGAGELVLGQRAAARR
ncbi:MAG TPA: low temperature requirement protein A [Solirubrobacteraceae bacterium]|nr:low temperature requirement protein A [Solirubrobacteraceae bacterium]